MKSVNEETTKGPLTAVGGVPGEHKSMPPERAIHASGVNLSVKRVTLPKRTDQLSPLQWAGKNSGRDYNRSAVASVKSNPAVQAAAPRTHWRKGDAKVGGNKASRKDPRDVVRHLREVSGPSVRGRRPFPDRRFDSTLGYPGEGPEVVQCTLDTSCTVVGHYHRAKPAEGKLRRQLEEERKGKPRTKKYILCRMQTARDCLLVEHFHSEGPPPELRGFRSEIIVVNEDFPALTAVKANSQAVFIKRGRSPSPAPVRRPPHVAGAVVFPYDVEVSGECDVEFGNFSGASSPAVGPDPCTPSPRVAVEAGVVKACPSEQEDKKVVVVVVGEVKNNASSVPSIASGHCGILPYDSFSRSLGFGSGPWRSSPVGPAAPAEPGGVGLVISPKNLAPEVDLMATRQVVIYSNYYDRLDGGGKTGFLFDCVWKIKPVYNLVAAVFCLPRMQYESKFVRNDDCGLTLAENVDTNPIVTSQISIGGHRIVPESQEGSSHAFFMLSYNRCQTVDILTVLYERLFSSKSQLAARRYLTKDNKVSDTAVIAVMETVQQMPEFDSWSVNRSALINTVVHFTQQKVYEAYRISASLPLVVGPTFRHTGPSKMSRREGTRFL